MEMHFTAKNHFMMAKAHFSIVALENLIRVKRSFIKDYYFSPFP